MLAYDDSLREKSVSASQVLTESRHCMKEVVSRGLLADHVTDRSQVPVDPAWRSVAGLRVQSVADDRSVTLRMQHSSDKSILGSLSAPS